jgi:hypothetical protein
MHRSVMTLAVTSMVLGGSRSAMARTGDPDAPAAVPADDEPVASFTQTQSQGVLL